MQNLVGINGVDLANEGLVRRDTELVRFDCDGVLPDRTRRVVFYNERDGEFAYLYYGEDKHPGLNLQSNHKFDALIEYITPWEVGMLIFHPFPAPKSNFISGRGKEFILRLFALVPGIIADNRVV